MVDSYLYNEEKTRAIETAVKTAMEVFDFIITLPSPLGEFVFKKIVEDAYCIASVQQIDKVKEQLIKSICYCFEENQSVDPICSYLGINKYYKEVDCLVTDSDKFISKLTELCGFDHLPPIEQLLLTYPCFSYQLNSNIYIDNTRERVRKLVMEREKAEEKNAASDYLEVENCFLKLGFQTLFFKCAGNILPHKYDETFYQWYCNGLIIDTVLDTIFKCGVSSVSRSLWELLVQECEQHYYLSIITQKRYDYYRSYLPGLAFFMFDYKGEMKQDDVEYVAALPTIPKSKSDQTSIDKDKMSKLHEQLCLRGELNCTTECFISAFSGRAKTTIQIKWLKTQKELATFLYVLRAKEQKNKEYAKMAAKVFIQRNGKSCSWKTLDQPDYEIIRDYRELFNEIGITRNK